MNKYSLLLTIACLVTISAAAGCQNVGWLASALAPPKKIKALYEPPKEKKVLVLVDDLVHPVSYEQVKADLTEAINKQLIDNKVATQTVSYERLLDLKTVESNYNNLSNSEIAKKLQADLVLYVQVEKFALKEQDNLPFWHGQLETSIRWVSVDGQRLWPTDRPLQSVEEVEVPPEESSNPAYAAALSQKLCAVMADKIVKQFYERKVDRQQADEQEGSQRTLEDNYEKAWE